MVTVYYGNLINGETSETVVESENEDNDGTTLKSITLPAESLSHAKRDLPQNDMKLNAIVDGDGEEVVGGLEDGRRKKKKRRKHSHG
jgi:hypothetical protein